MMDINAPENAFFYSDIISEKGEKVKKFLLGNTDTAYRFVIAKNDHSVHKFCKKISTRPAVVGRACQVNVYS
jgi:hypothetical protein